MYEKNYRVRDHSTSTTELSPFGLHCRSLSGSLVDSSSYLLHRPILRVVNQFPRGIGENLPPLKMSGRLIRLSYLSVDVMPYKIAEFQYPNLKFLSVRFRCEIPSSILKMVNLKHLQFRSSATFSKSGQLPNLHVLKLIASAFVGGEWETRDGEFEELRFLKLEENCSKALDNCNPNLKDCSWTGALSCTKRFLVS